MRVDIPLNLRYGGIALFCIAPAIWLISGFGAIDALVKQSWPEATAEVLQSGVEVSKSPVAFSLKGRTAYADYFTARCTYAYEVNGKRFTQKGICAEAFNRAEVERDAMPYSTGNQITIYYSPRDPDYSILSKKADVVGLSLGFALGGLAIPLGLVLRKVARKMEPEPPTGSIPDYSTSHGASGVDLKESVPAQPFAARQPQTTGLSPFNLVLRGMAVGAGLLFVLLGGLCVAIALLMVVKGVNDPAVKEIDMAVRIIATGIFGLVATFGAFLIWCGLRRTRRVQHPIVGLAHPSTA